MSEKSKSTDKHTQLIEKALHHLCTNFSVIFKDNLRCKLSGSESESESESGFIGQVSLFHKQGILLGKVTLSVLTQNIQHNTIQYKQTNSATVQWAKEFKKVCTRRNGFCSRQLPLPLVTTDCKTYLMGEMMGGKAQEIK